MAEHSIDVNVKATTTSATGAAAEKFAKNTTAAANAAALNAKMFSNLNAGGSKTVTVLRSLNGALHGSQRGLLALAGQLGGLAGPAGVVALTVLALKKFTDAAEESAKRLREAYASVGNRAEILRLHQISQGNVTQEEAQKAAQEMAENQASKNMTIDRMTSLNSAILKARADNSRNVIWEGGVYSREGAIKQFDALEKDLQRYDDLIMANYDIVKKRQQIDKAELAEATAREKAGQKALRDAFAYLYRESPKALAAKDPKVKKEAETILAGTPTSLAAFMNSLDRLGGYTSNLMNAQASPELQEMKTQTLKLNQIVENTKKTSARYSS